MQGTELKLIVGVVLGSLLLIAGVAWLGAKVGPKESVVDPSAIIGPAYHTRGASGEQAKITIVEFSDFQCPACGAAFPVAKRVVGEYSDRVRLVYRHFPLITIHPNAQSAAYAAEAAGVQDKFWEAHDWLFENQDTWKDADVSAEYFFDQFGTQLKLDKDKFVADFEDPKLRQRVADDFSAGRGFNVNSTPTFFVYGERVVGALSYDEVMGRIGKSPY